MNAVRESFFNPTDVYIKFCSLRLFYWQQWIRHVRNKVVPCHACQLEIDYCQNLLIYRQKKDFHGKHVYPMRFRLEGVIKINDNSLAPCFICQFSTDCFENQSINLPRWWYCILCPLPYHTWFLLIDWNKLLSIFKHF